MQESEKNYFATIKNIPTNLQVGRRFLGNASARKKNHYYFMKASHIHESNQRGSQTKIIANYEVGTKKKKSIESPYLTLDNYFLTEKKKKKYCSRGDYSLSR